MDPDEVQKPEIPAKPLSLNLIATSSPPEDRAAPPSLPPKPGSPRGGQPKSAPTSPRDNTLKGVQFNETSSEESAETPEEPPEADQTGTDYKARKKKFLNPLGKSSRSSENIRAVSRTASPTGESRKKKGLRKLIPTSPRDTLKRTASQSYDSSSRINTSTTSLSNEDLMEVKVVGDWGKSETNNLAGKMRKEAAKLMKEKSVVQQNMKDLETQNSKLMKWKLILEKNGSEDLSKMEVIREEIGKAQRELKQYERVCKDLERQTETVQVNINKMLSNLKPYILNPPENLS